MFHFIRTITILALALAGALALSGSALEARAQNLYWDPEGTGTNNAAPGNGVWNTNAEWSTTSAVTTNLVAWSNGAVACFSAGELFFGTTVQLNTAASISGMQVGLPHTPPEALTIQGGGSLNLLAGQDIFAINITNETYTTSISVPLTGPGTAVFVGSGAVDLNEVNTYTGGTQIGALGASGNFLFVGNSNCFGPGPITFVNGGAALGIVPTGSVISNTVIATNGFINISGPTTFTGPWTISGVTDVSTPEYGGTSSINGPIGGDGSLTIGLYQSHVQLNGTNTYTGPTVITNGGNWLLLGPNGSINNSSAIIIENSIFDVAAIPAFTISTNTTLVAIGDGTSYLSEAEIYGATGGTVNLGSQPIILSYTPGSFSGDGGDPSLYVFESNLILSNNPVTITNASATPLGPGTYNVIQVGPTSAPGSVFGAPNPQVSVVGSGIAAGNIAFLAVTNGGVNLIVSPPVTSPPPVSAQVSSNEFQLTASVVPNAAYQVQTASNLIPPVAWTTIATSAADSNGVIQFNVTNFTSPGLFYRLLFP